MINPDENTGAPPIDRRHVNRSAAAHSRINLPLNLENWRHLPEETQNELMWFHQHLLDHHMGWDAAAESLGYSSDEEGSKVVFGILKGTFDGDLGAVLKRINDYRVIAEQRSGIKIATFEENPISSLVWAALDYALANNCITIIEGESGHGKTMCAEAWLTKRASGRGVRVEVPSIGGTRVFLAEIVKSLGGNKNLSIGQMREAILRGFGPNRILIIDEATRLVPRNLRGQPEKLEFLRELHDHTQCGLALFCTRELSDNLERSDYMFEQVLGRSLPVRLPIRLDEHVWRPVLVQYFPRPSDKLLTACEQLANNKIPLQKGRLRLLTQVLKLASRIASKKKVKLVEQHFFDALALRTQMSRREFGG